MIRRAFAATFFFAIGCAHASVAEDISARGCAAISSRVDAVRSTAPVLLRSYDDARGNVPTEPSLRTAAFVYDNSLAVIALISCGKRAEAIRIGAALRAGIVGSARLRNVYRAGEVPDKPLPNGWWDAASSRWVEDAYQDGTATGNVAWAGLAMLALYDATRDTMWRDAAKQTARWVMENTKDVRGDGGFTGGVDGFDAAPTKVLWKSTEHNIDLVALFDRLDRAYESDEWRDAEDHARDFVQSQFDASTGHFFVGTRIDGVTPNRDTSALDAQLWSQLIPGALPAWRRALDYARREHGVDGGFDFNADRDGAWIEGTAQAALVYRRVGRASDAEALFRTVDEQFSTSGMVYATREAKITTGLATNASGNAADFYYYRLPHLGATAWAVLAARNVNPFASAKP